jgi:hypothetical protein
VSNDSGATRRTRVQRNIYRRPTGVYEVGFKDAAGKQRWRTVDGGIRAARTLRDELLARRNRGERIAADGRLRFVDATSKWLERPVLDLRWRTQDCYRNAVENQLLARLGNRRLDAISPDDLALLVRNLRSAGLSESSIVIVVGVVNRIYRYAARRLGWSGINPVSLLLLRSDRSRRKASADASSRDASSSSRSRRQPSRTRRCSRWPP